VGVGASTTPELGDGSVGTFRYNVAMANDGDGFRVQRPSLRSLHAPRNRWTAVR